MKIKEVRQNWPDEYFKIDLNIGNICNFQCWYCWPGCHEGNYKWPDFDLYTRNLSHLLDYYIANTNKKKFMITLLGGEVTHWKRFKDFIKFFKERYDIIFTMHTNASKKLDWWVDAVPYLDTVSISHHQKFSKKEQNRELADYFYKNKVIVNVQVMMDPTEWDGCIEAVEYYKKSKFQWTIRHAEIIHENSKYTEEQRNVLKTLRARSMNPVFFWLNNKSPDSKTQVVDEDDVVHKINEQTIVLDRMNNFKGWDCNVGLDWLNVRPDGTLSGICSNMLYDQSTVFNLLDSDFIEKFHPTITSTVCQMPSCWCTFETNMPKRQLTTTQKVIPIHAN